MLTIGICDDDELFINSLYKILQEIMFPISDWKARIYSSGAEVLASISNQDFDCDLLFTDIFMENGNGMELAKYIFEHGIDTDVIFVSGSKDYVFESYRYHTFAYLLKPLSSSDIEREVRRYIEELTMSTKCLNLSVHGCTHKIPLNSITFIESNRRKVTVHTKRQDYDFYEKLDVLENMLQQDGFVRCHQSYLIRIDQIVSYNVNNTVTLNGYYDNIPVSRRHQQYVRNLLEHPTHIAVTESATALDPCDCYLTRSLNCNQPETGAFICIEGAYVGAIVRIKPEQTIVVGRDCTVSDFIVNLPLVSRQHCEIIYHANRREYEIIDYSSNGTYINGTQRLVSNETYVLKPGTELCFGDKTTIYKLG
jgi:DNA-binding LytR/AlgR family response regulator